MLTKKEPPKNDVKIKNLKSSTQTESHETYTLAKAPTQQPAIIPSSSSDKSKEHYPPASDRKTNQKTRITIKYDVGYNNQIYIRGKGSNLNWDKGQLLKNTKSDEWVWETDGNFSQCEFKVLINDCNYEQGNNRLINCGSNVTYTPSFLV
jgi:hypothetical protein